MFFLGNVLHQSLLISIARNITQHFSRTLRSHLKQQSNQQEAQKREKLGAQHPGRQLVSSVRVKTRRLRAAAFNRIQEHVHRATRFRLLHTCLQMASEASWILI